jgi:sugar lactone lactonase YvrE
VGNLFISEGNRLSRITPAGNLAAAISYSIDSMGAYVSRDGPWGTASVGRAGDLALMPDGNFAILDSLAGAVRLVSPLLTMTTLAGAGAINGYVDGLGASARFAPRTESANSKLTFGLGGLLLADAGNHRLRRIDVNSGRVETVAGNGSDGSDDGSALAASFGWPQGLASDGQGNLYVSDLTEHVIRRVSSSGVVTTIAGKAGQRGYADGSATAARFSTPYGLVIDSKGNLIVADTGNGVFRRIAPDGSVTTLAGKAGELGFVNGNGAEARLMSLMSLAIDKEDDVYFTENMHSVRKLSPSGDVSTVAGAPYAPGSVDDIAAFARFSNPRGLAVDARGNVYVCDTGNGTVRRLSPDGYVTTVLGQPGVSILKPGVGGSLNGPLAIAVSSEGRLFLLSEGAIVGD